MLNKYTLSQNMSAAFPKEDIVLVYFDLTLRHKFYKGTYYQS